MDPGMYLLYYSPNDIVYNYDSNTLTVKFNYGKEYMYFKVPSDTFISMKYSESIGKFFKKDLIFSTCL